MCTVSYLPKGSGDFILTHNRDEHHLRAIALFPEVKQMYDYKIITPTDAQAGGTWIATSKDFTLCLLNGGFVKHKHNPPYRHSRGKVILDFFAYADVQKFKSSYDLTAIEPFTLVVVDHVENELHQLVCDAEVFHHTVLNSTLPHLWSSSTLYAPEDIERRADYFSRFLKNDFLTQDEIIKFHMNDFEVYENEGIRINRADVLKTVSLTSIIKADAISMYYNDLIQNKSLRIEL